MPDRIAMTTLRVLATAAPTGARALPWALFDATGTRRETGIGRPDTWPAADRIEIVIAAAQARIACVVLPPLAPGRVAGAAAFAVEDQIAGPADTQQLTASAQRADGQVRVVIVAKEFIAACGAFAHRGRTATRIIAEPDLVAPDGAWHWCAGEATGHDGFLRIGDGRALPAGAIFADGLPAELVLALKQAQREGRLPVEIHVDAANRGRALRTMEGGDRDDIRSGQAMALARRRRCRVRTGARFATARSDETGDVRTRPAAPLRSRARDRRRGHRAPCCPDARRVGLA